jgi:hypothetical protein
MWKGRNIFRAYNPFVKNPRTEKQQLQRARFGVIAKLATSMSNVVNFGFASKAGQERNLPRALFIRENMPCVHANTVDSVTVDYADLVVSRGGLDTPRFGTPQFDTPQQVDVSFNTDLLGCATADDKIALFVYCPDAKAGILSPLSGASMVKRSAGSISVDVPAYWSGMKVHVWGFALAGVDEPTYIDDYGGWMYPQMASDSVYIGTGNID